MAKPNLTAIIYDKRGKILSVGKNSYVKTHPLMKKMAERVGDPHKVFLHAEVAAIVRCQNLEDAHKIAVFRYNKKGEPVNAKPCEVCQEALRMVGISNIEHT